MKTKIKNNIPIIISVCMLAVLLAITNIQSDKPEKEAKQPEAVNTVSIKKEETRGLWVTYMDLNLSGTDYSFKSFKKKFNSIADKSKEYKFNTLIVQVRPFSDALYKSKYYPCSHIISGCQGKNTDYDALKYMTDYAHKNGLRIHAWINPYRVKNKGDLKLSNDNPYIKDKSIGVKFDGGIYLNPSIKKARTLIENGVKEIVTNYDVDGVQFDDYFYPTAKESFDKEHYDKYKKLMKSNALPLDRWRMTNVNVLIADCFEICHKYNKIFGIAPQGNIQNDYGMYADVKSWCSQYGYIDYICPQLYYSLDNPALSFKEALNNWQALNYDDSVTLYAGIAGYKAGTDDDSGTWKKSDTILQKELRLIRKQKLKGFMFYSYADLISKKAEKEVKNLIKELN